VLPDDVDDAALEAIARGQREASEEAGAPVVGGNLARGPALSIATTVLGRVLGRVLARGARAVQRRGARPGDGLWLAGPVGLAAAGLQALMQGREGEAALAEAVAAWRTPRARLVEGLAMAGVAGAAIDVSDGLARDAGHVAEASGVRVVLDEEALRDAPLVAAAAALGVDPLDLALHGGEDYALVAASVAPIQGFRRVGEIQAGDGVVLRGAGGERRIEPRGYDHFVDVTGTRREA
jgi:thiamine-monophosphate kinase